VSNIYTILGACQIGAGDFAEAYSNVMPVTIKNARKMLSYAIKMGRSIEKKFYRTWDYDQLEIMAREEEARIASGKDVDMDSVEELMAALNIRRSALKPAAALNKTKPSTSAPAASSGPSTASKIGAAVSQKLGDIKTYLIPPKAPAKPFSKAVFANTEADYSPLFKAALNTEYAAVKDAIAKTPNGILAKELEGLVRIVPVRAATYMKNKIAAEDPKRTTTSKNIFDAALEKVVSTKKMPNEENSVALTVDTFDYVENNVKQLMERPGYYLIAPPTSEFVNAIEYVLTHVRTQENAQGLLNLYMKAHPDKSDSPYAIMLRDIIAQPGKNRFYPKSNTDTENAISQ
jgi:hypothetical protein